MYCGPAHAFTIRLGTNGCNSLSTECGKTLYNPDRLDADTDHLTDQAHDVAGIVVAIRIGLAFDLVLVDHPFERRPRAEAVFERLRRNAVECEGLVRPLSTRRALDDPKPQ